MFQKKAFRRGKEVLKESSMVIPCKICGKNTNGINKVCDGEQSHFDFSVLDYKRAGLGELWISLNEKEIGRLNGLARENTIIRESLEITRTNVKVLSRQLKEKSEQYTKIKDKGAKLSMIYDLVADDVCMLGKENNFDVVLYAIVNDCFVRGADAEKVPMKELEAVHKAYKNHGSIGIIAWVAARRKVALLPEIQKELDDFFEIINSPKGKK